MQTIEKRHMSNTVVPDAWIIEEQLRRDRERKKREGGGVPYELPVHSPHTWDYPNYPEQGETKKKPEKKDNVTIIEL